MSNSSHLASHRQRTLGGDAHTVWPGPGYDTAKGGSASQFVKGKLHTTLSHTSTHTVTNTPHTCSRPGRAGLNMGTYIIHAPHTPRLAYIQPPTSSPDPCTPGGRTVLPVAALSPACYCQQPAGGSTRGAAQGRAARASACPWHTPGMALGEAALLTGCSKAQVLAPCCCPTTQPQPGKPLH